MSAPLIAPDLIDALKRLRLGRIAATLPERLVLADKQDMPFEDLLLMILTDEIARRESTAADNRASDAGSIRRCASSSGTRLPRSRSTSVCSRNS